MDSVAPNTTHIAPAVNPVTSGGENLSVFELQKCLGEGFYPEGYCYLMLVMQNELVSVGMALGVFPCVGDILRLPASVCVDLGACKYLRMQKSGDDWHLTSVNCSSDAFSCDAVTFLKASSRLASWPKGSFGEYVALATGPLFSYHEPGDLSVKLGGRVSFDSPNSQFFKPTGFESPFEVEPVEALEPVLSTHKRTLDEAVRHICEQRAVKSAVAVSLEPGSGKTTVLPFRFSETPVCVVLPTGFDALAAYRLASSTANIDTSLVKETNGSNVTYMDSYTAGMYLFQHRSQFPFKVVIIDESDSSAGITKTLTEVTFPGAYTIHLSGTPAGRELVSTTAYEVEMYDTLPELSDVYFEAVDFIKNRCRAGRGLVMVPNAAVAKQIHSMIKNSRKIDCDMSVEELDSIIQDQSRDEIIIADDSCTRGYNLNLDVTFDFQLVSCGPETRAVTSHEQLQRKTRVGRTKPGTYYYTPRAFSGSSFSKWDVFRNNVARAVFGLPEEPCDLKVDTKRLQQLMVSTVEPYELQVSLPLLVDGSDKLGGKTDKPRRKSSVVENVPQWVLWTSGYMGRRGSGSDTGSVAVLSSSSSSSSSLRPSHSVSVVGSPVSGSGVLSSVATTVHGSKFDAGKVSRQAIPSNPTPNPVIDLSTASDGTWPDALREAYNRGDRLCMVKPGQWVYAHANSGVDCMQRLLAVIREGPTFSLAEMEVVCRAWNVLVSRMNFAFASGKDAWGDRDKVMFILDYFSSYNTLILN